MTDQNKKTGAVKLEITLLLDLYPPRVLEDIFFDVFNQDTKRDDLTADDREERAVLHKMLRSILREITHDPKTINQLLA